MISLRNCSSRKILILAMASLAWIGGSPAIAQQHAPSGGSPLFRLAVFPVENLSNESAPLREIRRSLSNKLLARGVRVIDDESLERVMAHHRIRYTGGMGAETAKALRDESNADAVLITSLELYLPGNPPKMAVTARLIATDTLEIIWAESIGVAGDDTPGVLGLGLISDPQKLREKAVRQLATSLADYLERSRDKRPAGGTARAFRPKLFFAGKDIERVRKSTIAVIPFFNESPRRHGGEIAQLHFLKQLVGTDALMVMEPGIIRERMLDKRIILNQGVSYRDTDLLGIPLKIDYLLTGSLFDYQDYDGPSIPPRIDFSTLLLEVKDRKIVSASKSYNAGDDAVFFFDVGRVSTASVMADKMMHAVAVRMFGEK